MSLARTSVLVVWGGSTPPPDDPIELLEAEDRLVRWHEQRCADLRKMFRDIVTLDEAESWRTDGATSMADWLAYRLALSHRTTVAWVEVSHALVRLPHIARAFEEARFSWDQIRWLSIVAPPAGSSRRAW